MKRLSSMKLSRKLFLGFAVIILLMITLLGYTYFNYIKQVEAVELNLHTYEVMREADGITASMLEMESSARGYALSGKESFLEPYYEGKAAYETHLKVIRTLTVDNAIQQERLDRIELRYETWYEWENTQIIEGRKQVNDNLIEIDEITYRVQTDKGKNEMDSIRQILKEMIQEEQLLLNVRNQELIFTESRTGYIISLGGLAAVLGGIVIALFTAHTVSMPVRLLIQSAENITAENYQEPIRMEADKELNLLIGHFNCMQAAIQSREEELKKKNDALKEQMGAAKEANRLKSQFLANMSHELRTPLNSIIGFTTRVLKKSGDMLPTQQRENLDIVKSEALHLLAVINDLLDYSKIEAGKMEVHAECFDIKEVLNEVTGMMSPLWSEKGLLFECRLLDPDNVSVYNDRLKIKQVLINLLSNAYKYSEHGRVCLSVDFKEDRYVFQVRDEGVGIAGENLNKIFDEFRQVDGTYTRKVGGTGLGLSITKKLVELMGGTISVESEIGKGSCFTVSLPASIGMELQAACSTNVGFSAGSAPSPFSAGRIVCVDDDSNVQKLYRQYLGEHHFEMISLDGSEDVVNSIMELQPDLIILDIMLPNKDGWQILFELKNHAMTRKIPVIMASVLSEKNLAYRMKADDYLIKPVAQEELYEAISRTIAKKNGIEVLIADDDENFVHLVGQYLKEEGISFDFVSDGEAVLGKMLANKPDIVILDIMMPKKDGFSVIEEIRNREEIKDTAVIVVTSKDLTLKEKEELQKRSDMIIQKSGSLIENVMGTLVKKVKASMETALNAGERDRDKDQSI